MHVTQIEYNAAWMPFEARPDRAAGQRLAQWLNENERRGGAKRVIMTPLKSNEINDPPVLKALADRSEHVLERSDNAPRGGPVVAAWPTEEALMRCVARVGQSTLTTFEWGKAPGLLGWATATGAYNAQTGELTPQLDPELHEEFVHMLFRDDYLSAPPKSGRDREHVWEYIRMFRDAGLDEDFVVTYLIALGCTRDPKRIREHYRATPL